MYIHFKLPWFGFDEFCLEPFLRNYPWKSSRRQDFLWSWTVIERTYGQSHSTWLNLTSCFQFVCMVRASFLYTHNQEQNVQILYTARGNHSTGTVQASVLPPAGGKKEMNFRQPWALKSASAPIYKAPTYVLTNILGVCRFYGWFNYVIVYLIRF